MGLAKMKPLVIFILSASAIFLVLSGVYNTQTGRRFMFWCMKRSLMFTLGEQQFKNLYDGRCLVQNVYVKTELDEEQCELCENSRLLKINITKTDEIMELLRWDIPILINNPAYRFGMDLSEFADSFLLSKDLALFQPCQFKSNKKSKVSEHRQLMNMVSRGKVTSFYVLWENCAEISLKAFRQFYTRPSFLGNNVQLTGTNWAFICSDYRSQNFKHIETFSQLVAVFVQTGTAEARLYPVQICANVCAMISVNLTSGDTLLFSGSLYSLSIRPECQGEDTLIFGVGGYFD